MKHIYYTNAEALKAAKEQADKVNGRIVSTAFDSASCKSAEESDNFREIVGLWDGILSGYRVEDEEGQIVDYFGYWELGSEEFYDGRVHVYITEDEWLVKMQCGWAIYPRGSYSLAEALIDQYYLDDEDWESDPQYKEMTDALTHLADVIESGARY